MLSQDELMGQRPNFKSLDRRLTGLAGGLLTEVQGEVGYHYETACGFFIDGPAVIRADAAEGVSCVVASSYEVKSKSIRSEWNSWRSNWRAAAA
jgi:hypothetical protein